MRLFAQVGDRGRCVKCGRVLSFERIAYDALSGEPIYRWIAVRRTKLARSPIVCPGDARKGYHRPEGFSVTGAPIHA